MSSRVHPSPSPREEAVNRIGPKTLKLAPILVLILVVAGRAVETAPRSYDVKFAYVGFLSEYGPVCVPQPNPKGYDSLTGTLTGIENPAGSDEDVVYKGRAERKTSVD